MRMYRLTLRLLSVVALMAAAVGAQAQPLQAQPVAPGVWMVQGLAALGTPANRNFISNAAFVVTSEGVVVVDALGSTALAQELLQGYPLRTFKPEELKFGRKTYEIGDITIGQDEIKVQLK